MAIQYLRRYTDLPSLISMLRKRTITLLDPKYWDDKNDSYFLGVYKEKKKLSSVLALCFTQAHETYHHWKVFAKSSSGVCVFFHRKKILSELTQQRNIRSGPVQYYTTREIRLHQPKIQDLPFIKRRAFEDDKEYRIIYESSSKKISKVDISIPLECIARIVLSPWLQKDLAESVKDVLHSVPGCGPIEIIRSTMVNNREWKSIGDETK